MGSEPRKVKSAEGKELNNLLSQIAVCPDCGHKMIATTEKYESKKKGTRYYHTYVCGYNNNHKKCCHRNSVRAEKIDIPVIETLQEYIQKDQFIEDVKKKIGCKIEKDNLKEDIESFKKKIESLDKKLNYQYKLIEDISIDSKYRYVRTEKILETIENSEKEKEKLLNVLKEKEKELEAAESERLTIEKIENAIKNFGNIFKNSSKELQRELIRHFVEEVKLGRDSVNNKIYAKSMVIKFTGEEIELVTEKLEDEKKMSAQNLGVEKVHDESVIMMQLVEK